MKNREKTKTKGFTPNLSACQKGGDSSHFCRRTTLGLLVILASFSPYASWAQPTTNHTDADPRSPTPAPRPLVPTDRLVALPPLTSQEKEKNGNGHNNEHGLNNGNDHGLPSGHPTPTPIRLPGLPSRFISAAPIAPPKRPRETPEPKNVLPTPAPTAVALKNTPTPTPTPALDQEAFAAFAAFKKRQLDALASDRETLAALQAAIADLGLQEKLSFINQQDDVSDLKSEMKTYPKILVKPTSETPSPAPTASGSPESSPAPAPTTEPSKTTEPPKVSPDKTQTSDATGTGTEPRAKTETGTGTGTGTGNGNGNGNGTGSGSKTAPLAATPSAENHATPPASAPEAQPTPLPSPSPSPLASPSTPPSAPSSPHSAPLPSAAKAHKE